MQYDDLSNLLLTQNHTAQVLAIDEEQRFGRKVVIIFITCNVFSGYIPESNLLSNILNFDPNLMRLLGFSWIAFSH